MNKINCSSEEIMLHPIFKYALKMSKELRDERSVERINGAIVENIKQNPWRLKQYIQGLKILNNFIIRLEILNIIF